MKKTLTFVIVVCALTLNAQSGQTYTELFDSIFANVDMSSVSSGILYDRVVPVSDATKYNSLLNSNMDTINNFIFFQCYYEMLLSTIDTSSTIFPSIEHLTTQIHNDSIVDIGLMHLTINTIDTSVAAQKLYFDEDGVLRENTSISRSLFKEHEIFLASSLVPTVVYETSVLFNFSDSFIFDNCKNNIVELNVDFGDGNGLNTIKIPSIERVNYNDTGLYVIRFRILCDDGKQLDVCSRIRCSKHPKSVQHPPREYSIIASIPFTDYFNETSYGEGTLRIYYSNNDRKLRKPILIVDGFDPQNDRHIEENGVDKTSLWSMLSYDNGKHIGDTLITKYGYDLVFLDYQDGGDYIERNAMVCVEAIRLINSLLQESGSLEQIIIIGPSMGGQVTHYALSYIEKNINENTNYGKHNCRLWVSFDSPQQGANISIGAQAFMYFFGIKGNNLSAKKAWQELLNCPAAQQMLIYHFNTAVPHLDTFNISPSIKNSFFLQHYDTMNTMGYPHDLRKISVIDGSINGVSNNTGCSEAIDMKALGNIRISKIQLFPTNGLCEVFYGMYSPNTLAYIFGNRLKCWAFAPSVNNYSIDGAAGGTFNTFDILYSAAQNNSSIDTIPTNIHTHCFMPITSTLDINGNMNYCTNISSRDLVAENLTPFDSYIGLTDSNMYHATLNQHLVDYMLNEIESFIQGPREIQLCTRPVYSLHLPQDSTAEVTWLSSDNIRIIYTSDPTEVIIMPMSTGNGWISAEVSSLKHRKRLANYPISISINENNNLPIISTTTIPQQTLTISGEMLLPDTFCVENGKILTITSTGVLHCSSGTRLIVRPGGKLVVDGGVLTSSCANEMWQGIEVVGDRTKHQAAAFQGVVELKNEAIIENAHCAIRTGLGDDNWNTTGGIIKADNSHFINNQRAIEFLSYVDTVPGSGALRDNYSYFNKCEFKLDNNNLFGYNDCDFIDHVTLWRVKGVKFKGCSFTNQTNELYTRKHAIYALDAGITLDSYCSNSQIFLPTGCDCPASYSTYNSFSGFSTAVEVNTSGDQFAVRINHALFNNNGTAILIKGNPFTTISRCEVNLQNVPTWSLDNRGLVLDHCSGYKVEDNTFSRNTYYPQQLVSTGIYVDNSGDSIDNFLHLNNFINMNYGIYVKGNNGNSHFGLQITCCDFDHNGYDIFMSNGSSLKCVQGWTNKGADNDFSNTRTSSIYNAGTQFVSYYHSHDVEHVPYNVSSSHISVIDYATANSCESTLCNLGNSPITLTNFNSMMNNYISAEINLQQTFMDGMQDNLSGETVSSTFQTEMSSLIGMRQNLSEIYYESVRALMADSSVNFNELEQWHTVAQPISDPYSLTETRFQNGNVNSTVIAETMEETYNYADFHSLKTHCWSGRDGINWYELSNLQIEQLKTIAELNTGRSSVMAKGVLCFIFGICYDDDWSTEEDSGTRSAKATPNNNETSSLVVYPNPTDNLLFVELLNSSIENVLIYDLQGRVVESAMSLKDGFTIVNVSTIPAGVYLIHVTDEQGSLYYQKFVKK